MSGRESFLLALVTSALALLVLGCATQSLPAAARQTAVPTAEARPGAGADPTGAPAPAATKGPGLVSTPPMGSGPLPTVTPAVPPGSGPNPQPPGVGVLPTPAATLSAGSVSVPFTGIDGRITLSSVRGATAVAVAADDFGPSTEHAARILAGRCDAPGRPVADLPTLQADSLGKVRATAYLNIGYTTVTDGDHVLALYFGPVADASRIIACADIPRPGN